MENWKRLLAGENLYVNTATLLEIREAFKEEKEIKRLVSYYINSDLLDIWITKEK